MSRRRLEARDGAGRKEMSRPYWPLETTWRMSIVNLEQGTCIWLQFPKGHLEASLKGLPPLPPSTSSEPLTWSQITLNHVSRFSCFCLVFPQRSLTLQGPETRAPSAAHTDSHKALKTVGASGEHMPKEEANPHTRWSLPVQRENQPSYVNSCEIVRHLLPNFIDEFICIYGILHRIG